MLVRRFNTNEEGIKHSVDGDYNSLTFHLCTSFEPCLLNVNERYYSKVKLSLKSTSVLTFCEVSQVFSSNFYPLNLSPVIILL